METVVKKLLLFLLVTLIIAACGPAAQQSAAAPLSLTVCYTQPSATQALTWYAFEKGFFEKHGLQVNLVQMSGGSKAIAAMISGDIEICQIAASPVINAVAAGQDIVLVAGLYNKFPAALVTQPGITTLEELRGKTIAITAPGEATEAAARLSLQELGLDPDTDVILLNIGSGAERILAMEAGTVDASFLSPPHLHILLGKGYPMLFDLSEVNVPYAHTAIATSRKFIQENRPAVLAFMKGLIEASYAIRTDSEGAKVTMAKYMELDINDNSGELDDAYQNVILAYLEDVPYPSLEGLQTLINIGVQTNPDAANVTPEQLVDMSLIKELEESGFIDSVHK